MEQMQLDRRTFQTLTKQDIDIHIICSNYHVELNPGSVGLDDQFELTLYSQSSIIPSFRLFSSLLLRRPNSNESNFDRKVAHSKEEAATRVSNS